MLTERALPDERITARSALDSVRETLLSELLRMIPKEKRIEAEHILREIETTYRMQQAVGPRTEQALVSPPANAFILRVLQNEGRPLEFEELVDRVLAMGFESQNPSVKQRRGNVGRSIKQYLGGVAGSRKRLLKEKNGQIGIKEWPDSWFE